MAWDDSKDPEDLIRSSEWNTMVSDQKGRVVGTSISEVIADTSGNLPAAGTSGRIFFETDTGRTLYDNGTSWIEMGLSESQISLANLGSNAHADLSAIGSDDHHIRPIAGTHLSEDASDNFNVTPSSIDATNLDGSAGTSGQFLQTDGTNLSFADVSAGGKFEDALANGKVLTDDGNLYSSIQTAENNATSWMFVGAGTFNESLLVDTAGLTIKGTGRSSVISSSSVNDIEVSADNVTIKGLAFDSNSLQSYGNNVTIERVDNLGGSGGYTVGTRNTLKDCTAIGAADGITINGDGGEVKGCKLIDCSGPITVSFSKGINIVDNVIDATNQASDSQGISAGEKTTVSNNYIKEVGFDALNIGGQDAIVSNNIIENPGGNGISCYSGNSDSIISDNRILNSGDNGILVSATDVIIANNRISGSTNTNLDTSSATNSVLDSNLTGAAN